MQNLLGYGGESYVKDGVIRHYVGAARTSWVDRDDLSAAAAAALLDPKSMLAKHTDSAMRPQTRRLTYDQ